ncbi:MAG: hypothetical protein MPN21_21145 [Thermoanaerobaculia bacterium]|nr:hypothetical protein [Thermoanaerobaculia bacterium]
MTCAVGLHIVPALMKLFGSDSLVLQCSAPRVEAAVCADAASVSSSLVLSSLSLLLGLLLLIGNIPGAS